MEAMMTIGEFASQTGLSVSALRFYADRGLLVPASIDVRSGYRRYRTDQVVDGELVRYLRRLEMPLTGIAQALDSNEADRAALVAAHVRSLESVVHRAHALAQQLGVEIERTESAQQETDMNSQTNTITIAGEELAAALRQILPSASTDPERPHLMGVLVEAKGASLRIVATDGHRLAVRDLVPRTIEGSFTAVAAAASLAAWLEQLESQETITMSVHDRRIRVEGGAELIAEVLPVDFPDYERYLAADERASRAVIAKPALLDALEAFEGTDPVHVEFGQGSVEMRRDTISRSVSASNDGAQSHFAIDPTFMRQAASAALGPEVVIEADDEAAPVIFRSADDGTYTSLVMPVLVRAKDSVLLLVSPSSCLWSTASGSSSARS